MANEHEFNELLRAQEEEVKSRMLKARRLAREVWEQAGFPETDTIALALLACELSRHIQADPRRSP